MSEKGKFKFSVRMKPTDTVESIQDKLFRKYKRKYEIDEIHILDYGVDKSNLRIIGRKRGFIERMVLAIKRSKK